MIEIFKKELTSINIEGLHHLRSDLPKVRENLDINFIGKIQIKEITLGIYKYVNHWDKYGLKMIHAPQTKGSNYKIIHVDDLMPIGDDAVNLSKALKNKPTTQGIFNFKFKIDENAFSLSLHINSPLKQYFAIISKL